MGYEGAGREWSMLVYVVYMCEIVTSNFIKIETRKKPKKEKI